MDDGIHPGWRTDLQAYDLDSVLRCAACGINSSHFILLLLFFFFFSFFFSLSRMARVMKALISKTLPPSIPRSRSSPLAPFRSPSSGIKMKKSFPEMTEEKLSPAPSHSLAFDHWSHSGICSRHLECYLLFPLGIEGSNVIAKYCFFHELSKRTHTAFFKKYHLLEIFFFIPKAVPMILGTKAHPLKTCTLKGKYPLLHRHWCNQVVSKDMAEAGLPRGLGFLKFF